MWREVTYKLYGDDDNPLDTHEGAVIAEHKSPVYGRMPDDSASDPGHDFVDDISIERTGNFGAKQTFTAETASGQYSLGIRRNLPGPPSFNYIRAEAQDIWINGFKNTEADGKRKQCPSHF